MNPFDRDVTVYPTRMLTVLESAGVTTLVTCPTSFQLPDEMEVVDPCQPGAGEGVVPLWGRSTLVEWRLEVEDR